ncbi:MAG: T9SS type A sorting domain-containing protein [Flavobacteriales bacterium]|nr:T9SS type A sorting domain-containing protein [Flavobacteriales bacterium]
MRRILLALAVLFSANAFAQDTTWIQTLNFSDITKRRDWYQFPDGSDEYRKVLMYYTLKCDAATTQDGYACGEWDYLTYTYVYDHTGVLDSNLLNHPHYMVGNANWTDSLHYSFGPVYDTIETYQYQQIIDNINSETAYSVGTTDGTTNHPFSGQQHVRTQFLWTATELSNAGLATGDIQQLRFDVSSLGDDLSNVTIRMKNTSTSQLTMFENGGFGDYFLSPVSFATTGWQNFNLLTPFNWDGASNVIVEVGYDLPTTVNGTELNSESVDSMAVVNQTEDRMVTFDEGNYLGIPLNGHDFGDEVTISFWAYGDTAVMPDNSYAFEAVDIDNNRVLNCHLPWGNENVYWDAGEGSGYDRINKAATAAEYEGNWVHWAFTKNAASGEMKIYKNGSLWHSGTGLNRSIGAITKFNLGKSATGNGIWHGNMDEFQVWDVELDAATISDWMYRTVDNTHPNWNDLVVYYDFNDETMVSDASGNGNDAAMFGPAAQPLKFGDDNFFNTQILAERPVIQFVQGDYDTHLDSVVVSNTQLSEPSTLTSFTTTDHSVHIEASAQVYTGYAYTYHPDGTMDSVAIDATGSMYNDTLFYYGVPFEVIDRYEIARYITPYGIQLSLGPQGFTWIYDVTDYVDFLVDSVDLSAGNQQELIDVKFAMIKGTPMADVVELSRPWGQSGSYSYGNLDNDVSLSAVDVDIQPNAETFKLRTRLTGHGHNTSDPNGNYPHCCEWKDNTHYLKVNGSQAESWHIWQTHDCAQNPVYPQGGTWPDAREGWCPGDVVKDHDFLLTDLISGNSVNLDYDITPVPSNNPGMAGGNYIIAMQLFQYGAAKHTLDAEVYEVLSPTDWEYRSRTNPYCDDAKIVIRNAGATTLTSLTITYMVEGGQPQTYDWTGNLAFMETEEVTLPIDDATFWQGANTWKFIATVSAPNGGTDQYAGNDSYTSSFEMPPVYEGNFIVRYKTNNYPYENYWEIRDINGSVVASRTTADANTLYNDTMNLAPGCYTFYLYDSEDDGLSYWAWPNQGSGYCRLKANGGGYLKYFQAEFGGQITHGFSVGVLASVNEIESEHNIEVYPNPNTGQFTLEMAGLTGEYRIQVINTLGQVVSTKFADMNGFYETQFNLNSEENGLYFVRIVGDGVNETRRVVVSAP